jgi:hypothetical protein
MPNEGIIKAQHAIEAELKRQGQPVKAGSLLKEIRGNLEDVREIELRGAVWVLIGRGKVSLTPDWELTLASNGERLTPDT